MRDVLGILKVGKFDENPGLMSYLRYKLEIFNKEFDFPIDSTLKPQIVQKKLLSPFIKMLSNIDTKQ
jgi:hypothetical protein